MSPLLRIVELTNEREREAELREDSERTLQSVCQAAVRLVSHTVSFYSESISGL